MRICRLIWRFTDIFDNNETKKKTNELFLLFWQLILFHFLSIAARNGCPLPLPVWNRTRNCFPSSPRPNWRPVNGIPLKNSSGSWSMEKVFDFSLYFWHLLTGQIGVLSHSRWKYERKDFRRSWISGFLFLRSRNHSFSSLYPQTLKGLHRR